MIFSAGAGARPSAVSNLTAGELRRGSLEDDGVWVVNVADHKKKTSGMQPIPFIVDRRFEACLKFVEIYMPEANDEDYVFTNSNGSRSDAMVATNWLKTRFLSDFLTAKEMKTFTAKCWRHAWSNWAEDDTDPEMAALAAKVMMHSPGVRMKHYVEQKKSDAAKFSKAIIGHLVDRDDEEGLGRDDVEARETGKRTPKQTIKNGGRSGTRFTANERALLKKAFYIDGKPPEGINKDSVKKAKRKCPELVPLYERELNKERRIPSKVNAGIRKAIIPKGQK